MVDKNTTKKVLSLALPAVGEMILYMMVWVFDTMMVGQYGQDVAVSTVGLSSEIIYTMTNIFISVGISVGITSLVARRLGAKKYDEAKEYALAGLFVGAFAAFVISLSLFFFSPCILKFAGADSSVVSNGVMYMRIISFGIFFNMLMNMLNAILRGYGNTKTPLVGSIILNVVNLSLDYCLIFGKFGFPELGIKGAAIATATAQVISFLFILCYVMRNSIINIRLKYVKEIKRHMLKELLSLSIPSSLQEAAFDISRLLSTFMVVRLGTEAFAANTIATTLESVSFMPGWGFAVAATTLVGHKVGEKNIKGAKEYAKACSWFGVAVMGVCSVLFLAIPGPLVHLFIGDSGNSASVLSLGSKCLMIAAVEQPTMAVAMILGGALKGAGDTKTPFAMSFISSWIIRLPLMFYFIFTLKCPVTYVWWITAVQWAFEGTALAVLSKKRFNKLHKTVKAA